MSGNCLANLKRLQQDHPCVIHLIQTNFLRQPASINQPYQLNQQNVTDPSDGPSTAILRILRNQGQSALTPQIGGAMKPPILFKFAQ
ncbi:hypothetical protein OUZ56_012048 [Daphnia magna]|uniref:Uncharacterized protein n=1 Tax=Daphnia magna TaxID=35525 RepID=A0ABQ9Z237_9CRUS|nr:hypothetical protein OUZ56_012048 [Daphnia magna]